MPEVRESAVSITLVGFMGTGKSSVGRSLADRLNREFVDTDAMIEGALGRSIAEIFAESGEATFREEERTAIAAAVASPGCVIAAGGGAMLDPENVAALRAAGIILCLTARPDLILARIGSTDSRPLLAGAGDSLAAVEALLAERAPRYALADYSLDTSDLTLEAVVDCLCTRLPSLFEMRRIRCS
jgi:shikimate kinase